MKAKPRRTCPTCGNRFSGTMEFCPVCLVRMAIDRDAESAESSSEEEDEAASKEVPQRLGHYQLVRDENGKPVELGRGGMGITYKAFDVNLQYPVTLKVISERFLSDQS